MFWIVFIAGKLTVGKLYGGVLIYEIWKTTRCPQKKTSVIVACKVGCYCICHNLIPLLNLRITI